AIPHDAGLSHGQLASFYARIAQEKREFDEIGKVPARLRGEIVRQGFPVAKADAVDMKQSETGWEIEWDLAEVPENNRLHLLRILSATFHWKDAKRQARSLVVVKNLQLAEAFTQYDDRVTCFLDIAKVGVTQNLPANKDYLGPACVAPGEIVESINPKLKNQVHKEVHYDGIRWMNENGVAHRGEKFILWSAIRAGNYIYLIEYVFTDDGRIVCRLGFTAHNFFNLQKNKGDIHPHIGCW